MSLAAPVSQNIATVQVHSNLQAACSLAQRELVRFLRQRSRVIGALVTPIMFWALIGFGMGRSFTTSGQPIQGGYVEYFFPGTILMILLFTAIFSTISVIEDRREGFLQGVLVAPISRSAIVLGKVFGGTILATAQGLVFLLLAPLAGMTLSPSGFLATFGVMVVLGFALTSLGLCIAWRMQSTQGFHAIMNLFLMPMWFLSGALFPASGAMGGIGWVMRANPLTYGLSALRHTLYFGHPSPPVVAPGLLICLVISLSFAAVVFILASLIARKTTAGDLR